MADVIARYGGGGRHVGIGCERCPHCGELFDGVGYDGTTEMREVIR